MSHRVAFASILLVLLLAHASALLLDVKAGVERCLEEEVSKDVLALGEFEVKSVVEGMQSAVKITVLSPSREALYEKDDAAKGKFAFTGKEGGSHSVCINNHGSVERRVLLELKTGVEARDYAEVAKKEHLQPLEADLRRLEDAVDAIYQEMIYQREREETMRDTNESTNARVVAFSVVSVVALAVLGAWQMYSLKKFFKQKKVI